MQGPGDCLGNVVVHLPDLEYILLREYIVVEGCCR